MEKAINLTDSVFALCTAQPELKELLAELGFRDILLPGMLQTAGRFMTIPKGASLKGIDLNTVIAKLSQAGFHVMNE